MYNAEELIDMICNAEYTYITSGGDTRKMNIVSEYSSSASAERAAVAQAVYTWLGNQQLDVEKDRAFGELSAKVYAYEKIIANSNFSPMLDANKKAELDLSKIVVDSNTEEIIAVISKQDDIVKDGYNIVTTYAGNAPIFKEDNGSIKLNLIQWESEGTDESN